ncbi:hypothetical protein LTR16_005777, partial [Cryomyces antarcticus]
CLAPQICRPTLCPLGPSSTRQCWPAQCNLRNFALHHQHHILLARPTIHLFRRYTFPLRRSLRRIGESERERKHTLAGQRAVVPLLGQPELARSSQAQTERASRSAEPDTAGDDCERAEQRGGERGEWRARGGQVQEVWKYKLQGEGRKRGCCGRNEAGLHEVWYAGGL